VNEVQMALDDDETVKSDECLFFLHPHLPFEENEAFHKAVQTLSIKFNFLKISPQEVFEEKPPELVEKFLPPVHVDGYQEVEDALRGHYAAIHHMQISHFG
jgi:hypothetical protein